MLLGRERLTDLALNTFLPFLAAKAEVENADNTFTLARTAWEMLPRGQENHLLRDAVRRFLSPPSRSREVLRTASQQQGMMDIFQNFCLALDHACCECPFCHSVNQKALPREQTRTGQLVGDGGLEPSTSTV